MWKVKGSIRFFLSILATAFVQAGVFIYAQKILSGSFFAKDGIIWQNFLGVNKHTRLNKSCCKDR